MAWVGGVRTCITRDSPQSGSGRRPTQTVRMLHHTCMLFIIEKSNTDEVLKWWINRYKFRVSAHIMFHQEYQVHDSSTHDNILQERCDQDATLRNARYMTAALQLIPFYRGPSNQVMVLLSTNPQVGRSATDPIFLWSKASGRDAVVELDHLVSFDPPRGPRGTMVKEVRSAISPNAYRSVSSLHYGVQQE